MNNINAIFCSNLELARVNTKALSAFPLEAAALVLGVGGRFETVSSPADGTTGALRSESRVCALDYSIYNKCAKEG
jgi:hypothetical protein